LAFCLLASIGIADDKAAKNSQAQTFMGRVDGATADCQCAVVIDGKNVLAYICSADEKFNDLHSRWFRGTCTEGKIAAASADGAKLTGEQEGDKVTVSVKEEAATLKANLSLIERGAEVGLYRAVLKLDDGTQVVIGYMFRPGDESLEERMSGAIARPGQQGKSSGKLGKSKGPKRLGSLTLSKANCQIKKANLLRIQLAKLAKQQQEAVDVEAEQVDQVAAEDEAAAEAKAAEKEAAPAEQASNEKEDSKKKREGR
jgi:hypothetical protein